LKEAATSSIVIQKNKTNWRYIRFKSVKTLKKINSSSKKKNIEGKIDKCEELYILLRKQRTNNSGIKNQVFLGGCNLFQRKTIIMLVIGKESLIGSVTSGVKSIVFLMGKLSFGLINHLNM